MQQTLKSYQLYSRWVRAIEVYDRVIKIVSPKKAKLAEAETELARQMDKLNEKRTQLQQVTDKLQVSGHEFNGKIANFYLTTNPPTYLSVLDFSNLYFTKLIFELEF